MSEPFGAALKFLAQRYGGFLTEVESTPSVEIVAGQLIGFDAERISVVFVNLSLNSIYIGPRSDVSSTKGILVTPSGGAVAINVEEDGSLPTANWHAVASAAASAMYILEVKRDTVIEMAEVSQ